MRTPVAIALLLVAQVLRAGVDPSPPSLIADWRKQDGIGTARCPATYAAALDRLFTRTDALLQDLASSVDLGPLPGQWQALRQERDSLRDAPPTDPRWEPLWLRAHELRRRIIFANPLASTGPLLFIKQVPGSFSHQLTQYYGRYARPGGGICRLDAPGQSLACRELITSALPEGSYQTLELSYDGQCQRRRENCVNLPV